MEYLILIFCIIAVGAFLTFIFFQWLKIKENSNIRSEDNDGLAKF